MGFFEKLKEGLTKTKNAIFKQVDNLFKSFVKVDEDMLEELEELLIMADVGAASSEEIISRTPRKDQRGSHNRPGGMPDCAQRHTRRYDRRGRAAEARHKAKRYTRHRSERRRKDDVDRENRAQAKENGKHVMLAAADTFRAAAIDQLQIWADRVGVELIKHTEGSDPAAVVFDAASAAKKRQADVLIIDTAGRLHNKKNLMDELAKINRVVDRELPGCSRETLLVLDATTGQNAVSQAKEFKHAADITGLILTKLDGTAKGGIVFSIKKELDIPVKFIGVGEKYDDMQTFDAKQFVDALFEA